MRSHPQVVGGATSTADRFGAANSAMSFDGIDDKIIVNTPFGAASDDFSMVIWLQPTLINDGAWHGFLGYQDGTRSPSLWVNFNGCDVGFCDCSGLTGGITSWDCTECAPAGGNAADCVATCTFTNTIPGSAEVAATCTGISTATEVPQTCDLDATTDGTDTCPSGCANVAASAATICTDTDAGGLLTPATDGTSTCDLDVSTDSTADCPAGCTTDSVVASCTGTATVWALSGRVGDLSTFHSRSDFYGAFIWARGVLNGRKRRFLARAD